MDDGHDTRKRARRLATAVGFAAAIGGFCLALPAAGFAREPAAAQPSSPGDGTLQTPRVDHRAAKPGAESEARGGTERDGQGAADEGSKTENLDWFAMTMSALAGLVLFIFGVTQLAQGLGEIGRAHV